MNSPICQKYKEKLRLSSSPWKEDYRKKCRDRLRESRRKFVQNRRQSAGHELEPVEVIVDQEWASFSQGSELQNRSVDELLSLFEEVKTELLMEEELILREYEQHCRFDESELEATVDTANEVMCPVCQRHPLHLNRGIIFCACGVRLDTEQDCITLDFVQNNLRQASQAHSSSGCSSEAGYLVTDQVGIQNMLMTCATCDFMFVVI